MATNLKFVDILSNSSWSTKQKKKALSALFSGLVGGTCPLDALSLIIGRNKKLSEQQLKVVEDIVKCLQRSSVELVMLYHVTEIELLGILFESRVVSFTLRLICVHSPSSKTIDKNELKDPKNYEFTFRIRYACMYVLHWVTVSQNYTKPFWKDEMSNPDYFSVLMKCTKDSSMIIVVLALRLVNLTICGYGKHKWFEKYANQIDFSPLLYLLNKDAIINRSKEWREKGSLKCEDNILMSDEWMCNMLYQSSVDDVPVTINSIKETISKCVIAPIFIHCSGVFIQLSTISTIKKKIQAALHSADITPDLIKWFQVIPIGFNDEGKICGSIQLLTVIVEKNVAFTNKLLNHPKSMEFFRTLIQHPNEIICQYTIALVDVMMETVPLLRKTFVKDKVIIKAIINASFSGYKPIQKTAIVALFNMADKRTTNSILQNGFGGLELLKLHIYYKYLEEDLPLVLVLRNKLMKYSAERWRAEDDKAKDFVAKFETLLDIASIKTLGNDFYKMGNYTKASEIYTEAINLCPPTLSSRFTQDEQKFLAPEYAGDKSNWYPLPSALYSNRAQCCIHLSNYQNALEDCNKAIAFSYRGFAEGRTLLLKSVLRRSIINLNLKNYVDALRDAAYCYTQETKNTNFYTHFKTVFEKYRQEIGMSFLTKRCVCCLEGEGEKLKRCANCDEIYCSKKCQMDAWELGHKDWCRKINIA